MIRIAIVEDEERNRTVLVDHLRRYEQEHGLSFDIAVFADGREILAKYRPVYDIVLLDIQMEHVDGMTTAKRIREVDQDVVLVFITNSPQYAIGGYQVAALSYLLKPVPYVGLSEELDRCLAQVRKRERGFIMLTTGTEKHRVNVADIVYIESVKHRLVVHATDREYSLVGSLTAIEEELAGKDFFRSNNPYLVNLQHVTGVAQNSCILRGGHDLQISRPRKKAFLAALSDYVGASRA
jgi:DNA-binding LytR/AlgR family response regulator